MNGYNLIVKAGRNGTSYHMAREGTSAHGVKYLSSACGSGVTQWGGLDMLSKSVREFKRESITCKKCLKAYDKMITENDIVDPKQEIRDEIAELKARIKELESKLGEQ